MEFYFLVKKNRITTCNTYKYVVYYKHNFFILKEMILIKPKKLLKTLEQDGWKIVRIRGSHHILKHPVKEGLVTIPLHSQDLKPKTLSKILKQAGLK